MQKMLRIFCQVFTEKKVDSDPNVDSEQSSKGHGSLLSPTFFVFCLLQHRKSNLQACSKSNVHHLRNYQCLLITRYDRKKNISKRSLSRGDMAISRWTCCLQVEIHFTWPHWQLWPCQDGDFSNAKRVLEIFSGLGGAEMKFCIVIYAVVVPQFSEKSLWMSWSLDVRFVGKVTEFYTRVFLVSTKKIFLRIFRWRFSLVLEIATHNVVENFTCFQKNFFHYWDYIFL